MVYSGFSGFSALGFFVSPEGNSTVAQVRPTAGRDQISLIAGPQGAKAPEWGYWVMAHRGRRPNVNVHTSSLENHPLSLVAKERGYSI